MSEPGGAWELVRTETFLRALKKYLKKHPDRTNAVRSVLSQLAENPRVPKLRLRSLGGKFQDLHAVRVTYGDRIIMILAIHQRQVVLLDIGTHDNVYR
ncbi:MAG: plasmid stabilization protein [Lentisphaeria bacterium]|nr:plasmid stabilization protein [Lentisphaeria bacterium]